MQGLDKTYPQRRSLPSLFCRVLSKDFAECQIRVLGKAKLTVKQEIEVMVLTHGVAESHSGNTRQSTNMLCCLLGVKDEDTCPRHLSSIRAFIVSFCSPLPSVVWHVYRVWFVCRGNFGRRSAYNIFFRGPDKNLSTKDTTLRKYLDSVDRKSVV